MKKILFALLLLFSIKILSQDIYTYKKVTVNGQTVRLKGAIKIANDVIIITTKNSPSVEFKVKKDADANGVKVYSLTNEESKGKIRLSLHLTNPKMKGFVIESKDDFSGDISTAYYHLD